MNGEVIIGIAFDYRERERERDSNYKEAKNLNFLLV